MRPSDIITDLQDSFSAFLAERFEQRTPLPDSCALELNTDERKKTFGDMTTHAALVLGKLLRRPPATVAEIIRTEFKHSAIASIEIVGPGFVNVCLTLAAWRELARVIFEEHDNFFKLSPETPRKNFCVEFVSANPTGPLHFGHGRSGVIGDVLSRVLSFRGHHVTKEFYINDAGAQMRKLGASLKVRCQQAIGRTVTMPDDGYLGDYLITLAQELIQQEGPDVVAKEVEFFSAYAEKKMLRGINETLQAYGITFDRWFSERTLHETGAVETAVERLSAGGHCYQAEDALWFRSTDFGDSKDRVLQKSDLHWTYIAADAAYLLNKSERHTQLILVLGHDHHSFAIRLQGIARALNIAPTTLDIILYQLVKMKEGDALVQMSKRAGAMITLDEVIKTVGADVARFFYLNRKTDVPLEFDLELALKRSDENPVFYIQYAYVRLKSILAKSCELREQGVVGSDTALFLEPDAIPLLRKMASLRLLLATIERGYQTHLIAYYAIELADLFHQYYSTHRILNTGVKNENNGRLFLVTLLQRTFDLLLRLMGLHRPEKM